MELQTFITNFQNNLDPAPTQEITGETNFRELEEWDSLNALSIIAMIDDEYGVDITGDDIRNSNSISDLITLIKNKQK